eukprot:1271101-Amphidinium_carterae.1
MAEKSARAAGLLGKECHDLSNDGQCHQPVCKGLLHALQYTENPVLLSSQSQFPVLMNLDDNSSPDLKRFLVVLLHETCAHASCPSYPFHVFGQSLGR